MPTPGDLKSGIKCNKCGGVGHYAKNCPSQSKSPGSSDPPVKINMSVAKITTKQEYKQNLPETKKQLGKCPACNRAAHTYTRQLLRCEV